MFSDLAVLAMAKQRMDWVAQRHEVLAQNISNADTPNYKPRDLEPLNFKDALKSSASFTVATTHPAHMAPPSPLGAQTPRVIEDAEPAETAPNGNAVVLEEQMMKIGEAKSAYELAASLFKKHVGMIRKSIGSGGGG